MRLSGKWALAASCLVLATAVQAAFHGREIVRRPDMCNVDMIDTVSWYANESLRLTVEPWRCGERLEIPAGATAAWVVADEGGTNWIAKYDLAPTAHSATFFLGAGEGALPEDREYTGWVSLLAGTNVLGVLDRFAVRVERSTTDDGIEIVQPTSDLPAIFEAVRELIDGRYIAMVDGQWTVIRLPQAQALYLDGEEVLSARQEVESTARILGVKAAGNALEIRFLGAETNRLESCRDAETWDVVPDCTWGTDGGTGTVSVAAADSGSWYRIVAAGDVPGRTNTWLQAALPIYLGTKAATNRVATRGDVASSENSILDLLDAEYLKAEGNEPAAPGPVPQDPVLAWSITPTGSTFNAITMGGERRDTWPSFETGGPLYPCFIQAAGTRTNMATQYIPAGAQRQLGSILAVPLSKEDAPMVETSAASWTNARSSVDGALPHFTNTETMVWSVGNPWGWGTGTATGFWWSEAGPATGHWAVALGLYTGRTTVVKSTPATNLYWGWAGDVPGSLRADVNATMYGMATTPGKSMVPFADYSALETTNGRWNTNFWASEMDLTCVSPWNKLATSQSGYNNNASHTAITRRHIVAANHWHMAPSNGVLHFYDRANQVYTRSIVRGSRIDDTDCWVGMLDEDLPASIEPARLLHTNDWYKLLTPAPESQPLLVSKSPTERGTRFEAVHFRPYASRSVWLSLDGAATNLTVYAITNNQTLYKTGYWWTNQPFVGGESSSPILLWVDGQTVLVETMQLANGGGPNISALAPKIEAKIRAWGGTTETNLYWADLEKWPDCPAESEEE